jgi:hypothetical protein
VLVDAALSPDDAGGIRVHAITAGPTEAASLKEQGTHRGH